MRVIGVIFLFILWHGFLEIPAYGRSVGQSDDSLVVRSMALSRDVDQNYTPVDTLSQQRQVRGAQAELLAGKPEAALQMASDVIGKDVRYFPAYYIKVRAYVAQGAYHSALAVSDSTLMMAETPWNYYYQGWVNELLGSPQKAEWAYTKSFRVDSVFVEGYLALARLYINQSKLEKAIVLCEKALWIDDTNKEALVERSRVFALVHDYYEAIDDASLAIGIDSLYTYAYYLRGLYFWENFQPEEAVSSLTQAIALAPGYLEALLLRSEAYFTLQRLDSAMKDAQEVLLKSALYRGDNNYAKRANGLIQRFNQKENPPLP